MVKSFSEMDAGEQRDFLAYQMAFGTSNTSLFRKRIRSLAKRVHKTVEQVERDLKSDARVIKAQK